MDISPYLEHFLPRKDIKNIYSVGIYLPNIEFLQNFNQIFQLNNTEYILHICTFLFHVNTYDMWQIVLISLFLALDLSIYTQKIILKYAELN